jgi:hypothetical protein
VMAIVAARVLALLEPDTPATCQLSELASIDNPSSRNLCAALRLPTK